MFAEFVQVTIVVAPEMQIILYTTFCYNCFRYLILHGIIHRTFSCTWITNVLEDSAEVQSIGHKTVVSYIVTKQDILYILPVNI